MTFHKMSQAADKHGHVPTVFAVTKQGSRDRRRFTVSADQIKPQSALIRLEQSKLQQGALRHPDVVTWSGDGSPFGNFLVVSPRVHELLGMASLPRHKVHEAQVQWPQTAHKEHGRGAATYFVYTFGEADMLDALDLTKTSLTTTVRLLSERPNAHTELPAGAVATAAEAWAKAKEDVPEGQRPWVTPSALLYEELDFTSPHFPIHTGDFDLLYLDHSFDAWVSDELRAALTAMGATGIAFRETWDNTKIVAAPSTERSARSAKMMAFAMANAGEPASDPSFAKRLARRASVLSRRDRLAKQGRKQGPVEELELKLDVEFPAEYREALLKGNLPERGRFRFYAPTELCCIEDVDPTWTEKSAPQAVRSLLVAVDGTGDFLGYMLTEDSMTKLDDALMHFHHETGAITRSRFKLVLEEAADDEA